MEKGLKPIQNINTNVQPTKFASTDKSEQKQRTANSGLVKSGLEWQLSIRASNPCLRQAAKRHHHPQEATQAMQP
jgi:hypothetical protein